MKKRIVDRRRAVEKQGCLGLDDSWGLIPFVLLALWCLCGNSARAQAPPQPPTFAVESEETVSPLRLQPPCDYAPKQRATLPEPKDADRAEPAVVPLRDLTLDIRPTEGTLPEDEAARAFAEGQRGIAPVEVRPWPAFYYRRWSVPIRYPGPAFKLPHLRGRWCRGIKMATPRLSLKSVVRKLVASPHAVAKREKNACLPRK